MSEVTRMAFPGLGIGEFAVNRVAFTVPLFGGLEVRWYGIILTLGIIFGFSYALYRSKFEGVSTDDLMDFAIWTVLLAIVCARAYYVIFDPNKAANYHNFRDVIAIWEGGIAIYGSIIGGALGLFLVSRYKKYDRQKVIAVFDMVSPGVMLGQILGRWGNFVNGEAHGMQAKDTFFLRMGLYENPETGYSSATMYYFHPTFLYESLWNLLGFILINVLYKKKKFNGQITLMYLAWYGFGRMFIEGLRTDSLYIGVFRVSQIVGFLCFAICTTLLVLGLVRARRKQLDTGEYTPAFERLHRMPRAAKKQETPQNGIENTQTELQEQADDPAEDNKGDEKDGNDH